MAIRMRRGSRLNMDPAQLLPGEWAVCTSDAGESETGLAVYMCFASGDVRRVALVDDLAQAIADAVPDVAKEIADVATTTVNETYVKSATATTLPEGSEATAVIANNVLTLGIPKGDKGDPTTPTVSGETMVF